mmetsp:Transcript_22633/g.35406  ORF Transcript_22633/g.35406 Transcript_22633/m.35406 type:complete len:211 (-) Transcript_22633:768-1400(-)
MSSWYLQEDQQKTDGFPSWRSSLNRSLKKNRSVAYAKYMQVATVRPTGAPANRTVVFRGWVPDTHSFYFVTDSRSEKIGEIAQNPHTEIAWYFAVSREQYRISGKLSVIGPQDAADRPEHPLVQLRATAWKNMSDAGRNGFARPAPGVSPRVPDEELKSAEAPKDWPLDTFCIVIVEPSRVDWLLLKDAQPHVLHTTGTEGKWIETSVNP